MKAILDTAKQKMDALEQRIADYIEYQAKIQELEAYYTSQQWPWMKRASSLRD